MKRILKKSLALILALTMVFGAAPLAGLVGIELPSLKEVFADKAEAETETAITGTYGVLSYEINNGEVTITDCDTSASGELEIPESIEGYPVTKIGNYAFSGCSSLTSITIPDSVTSIGSSAFRNCTSLTSITVDKNNTNYSSDEYGVLFSKDKTELILYPAGNSRAQYIIPNGVISICQDAFDGCESLTSITIPNSVTSIGTAFSDTGIYKDKSNWENGVLYIDNHLIAAKSTVAGDYTIKSGTKTIAFYAFNYCFSLTSVTIPESVTNIGDHAFSYCTSLTSVTIGNSVTSIGDYAFSNCTSLANITIPDSVTSVGRDAFYNCISLTSVTIGNSVTNIGYEAFYNCTSLTDVYYTGNIESWCNITFSFYANPNYYAKNFYIDGVLVTDIVIPDTVSEIKAYAFYGCTSLSSVTIPDSVTSIGSSAFENCTSLTSITIPDSVTNIGYYAFRYCTSLNDIYYTGNIESWCNITFSSYANPNCYAKNFYINGDIVTDIVIPDTVSEIKDFVFEGCTSLSSVTIPDSVTSIGGSAFENCTSLTSITIPDSVTSIGGSAFRGCTSLKELTMPISAKIYTVNEYTFYGCKNIEKITLTKGDGTAQNYGTSRNSDSTTTYYKYTPWYISNCGTIILEDGVAAIGEYTFRELTNLANITIPDSVTSIGKYAFYGCSSLASVTIGNSVTSIGDYAFHNCTSLTSVTIGNSVTSIGDYAFSDCTSLANVTIGNSVTSIGDYAFSDCTSLANITIPDSVTSVGRDAFYNCASLTSVTIGNSVTNIGYEAFYNCTSLTDVYYTGTIESWCNISFGSSDANPNYYTKNFYIDGVLVTDIVIPDTVSEIKAYAFYGCTSLTGVTIPDSVTSIGGGAFSSCTSLTSATIPESVTSIGGEAFANCTSLSSITIPDSVTSIGGGAFMLCTGLTSITIPNGVTCIYDVTFAACTSLTSVTIPDSITSIGFMAFYNCTSLVSVKIPESVTSINSGAFYNCTSLTSITIPDSLTCIGNAVFATCTSLTSITIPDSVTSIGENAFAECTGLESVIIGNNITSIGESAFNGCSGIKTTYYCGTMSEWQNVTIDSGNEALTNIIIYEYGTDNANYGNGTCGENLTWKIDLDGNLIISGSGAIPDYSESSAPWYSQQDNIKNVIIAEGVTGIGASTFSGCTSLSSITIPDSVTSIGDSAFKDCKSLTSVHFEGSSEEYYEILIMENNEPLINASTSFGYYTVEWIFGDKTESKTVRVGDAIVPPEVEPEKGYSFVGWTPEIPDTMPSEDLVFTALFVVNSYDAIFDANGGVWADGSTIKTVSTEFGAEIIAPEAPEKQGYVFSGWTPTVGNMDDINGKHFTAVWVPATDTQYVVETYTMNTEGEYVKSVQTFTGETDSTVNAEYTVEEGFTFNEAKSVLSGTVAADNSLVLKVYVDRNKYSFTTIVDGVSTETKYFYDAIIAEPAIPSKTGYSFANWDNTIPATMPANDVTITAVFNANSYNAVFDANGGKWSDGALTKTVKTDFDSEIIAPANPERQGYDFAGWDCEIGIMDDVNGKIFNAKWTARNDTKYTVEIYTMGTDGKYSVTRENQTGTTDTEASVSANASTGFTLNSSKSKLSGNIAEDGSLVLSIYYDRNIYTFATVVNGETTSKSYYFDAAIEKPEDPVEPGYKFTGWDQTIPSKMPANDVTVTANFELSFKMSIRNPSTTTISYGDSIILHSELDGTLPAGARIEWTADNGNFGMNVSVDGMTCKISPKSNGKTVFTVTVYDKDGKVISTDSQEMTAKAGIWQKIVAFFKKIFGLTKTIPEMFKNINL